MIVRVISTLYQEKSSMDEVGMTIILSIRGHFSTVRVAYFDHPRAIFLAKYVK